MGVKVGLLHYYLITPEIILNLSLLEWRNLNRHFTFNKALHLYNRNASHKLKGSDISLLMAIQYSCTGEAGSSYLDVFNYLNSFYRGFPGKLLMDKLALFIDLGYIVASGSWPVRYTLTFAGKNILNELELKCRNTRYDK